MSQKEIINTLGEMDCNMTPMGLCLVRPAPQDNFEYAFTFGDNKTNDGVCKLCCHLVKRIVDETNTYNV
jgi:hypothetical protein